MRSWKRLSLSGVIAVAFALAGLASGTPVQAQATDEVPHPGRAVYETYCAACHNAPPPGDRAPPVAALRRMNAQVLMSAMTTGVMKPIGDGLDRRQLRDVVAEDAVEREKPAKKQMLVLVSEPEEGLPKDLTGWVVQLLEDDDPKEVSAKIVEVAKAFNESPKGQRVPVESFGDAVQSISGKLFKESDLWIKTREPVRIIPVKNSIGRRRRD